MTVVVSTMTLVIEDENGSQRAFTYLQSAEGVLAALQEILGVEPTEEAYSGLESLGVLYDFGGVVVDDVGTAERSNHIQAPAWTVEVTVADKEGVVFQTSDGIRVGDDAAVVQQKHPEGAGDGGIAAGPISDLRLDELIVGAEAGSSPATDLSMYTYLSVGESGGRIDAILAPYRPWGL